jgi:hypothetical protein
MNTRLSNLSFSRTATVSRVQLSPVTRRFKTAAIATPGARALPAIGSTQLRENTSFVPRLFSLGLLDRLQAPLTRHRD